MSIEAMKQALEALRFALHVGFDESSESQIKKGDKAVRQHQDAITALRTAIAEAEKQEPVAWANINKHGDITHTNNKRMPWSKTPLYTTPPAAQRQWVGFTDEEINEYDYEHRDFIYDIEALLKHKNTRLG